MNRIRRKRPRLWLEPEAYRQLSRELLARMDGAAKTAAQHKIFSSTTSAHAASSEMMPKRISLRSVRAVIEPDTYIATPRILQIGKTMTRTKTEIQALRAVEMARRTHGQDVQSAGTSLLSARIRIEQRFPKPRVGSSTLPRPTTLILSFSRSSTIRSIRRNAPKWCKCHKSVIVFSSIRAQTDQNESRPARRRAEQHLKLRPAIQVKPASELVRFLPDS